MILRFRHLLEKHNLSSIIFNEVNSYLEENDLLLKEGTITDATLISAPTSTKKTEEEKGPRDVFYQEREELLFWHEVSYWCAN